jgi:hypothetical protein
MMPYFGAQANWPTGRWAGRQASNPPPQSFAGPPQGYAGSMTGY